MDHIHDAINLLGAVIATMDRITVVGIENQNKFVGCAEAVQNASNHLNAFLAEQKMMEEKPKEETNA